MTESIDRTIQHVMCSECGSTTTCKVIFTFGSSRLLCYQCAGDSWDRKPGDDIAAVNAAKTWYKTRAIRTSRDVDAAIDMVNSPPHYQGKGMQAIDVIEAFELGYTLGNAIKYILRAGKKGEAKEDIEKALWYLRRYAEQL
jgi:hypothetical protein